MSKRRPRKKYHRKKPPVKPSVLFAQKTYTRIAQIISWIFNLVYWTVVIPSGIIIVIFLITWARTGHKDIAGYKPIIIETGSMNPAIQEKAIVVGKRPTSVSEVKVNDIITYKLVYNENEKLVTHRVINKEGEVFKTKGDANQRPDLHDGGGLKFDKIMYKLIYVNNDIAPFIAVVYNLALNPMPLIYAAVALIAFTILLKMLNKSLFKEEFKFGANKLKKDKKKT